MGRREPAGPGVRVRGLPPAAPSSQGRQLTSAAATFSFISTDPPAWAAAAAAMPSKFSCRQLRETGQCFESFLVDRGLDMETDRERLRTVYNWDFKIRYGPAHSPAQIRGPSSPPRPPPRGHPSRPGARRDAAPPVAQAGPGAAQTSPPAPCPRPASAARSPPALPSRAPAPSPGAAPPAQPAPPGGPGPGGERGPALTRRSRGRGAGGGGARRGGRGARGAGGPGIAGPREEAARRWRPALARALPGPPPRCRGAAAEGVRYPAEPRRPGVGGRIAGSSAKKKRAQTTCVPTLH